MNCQNRTAVTIRRHTGMQSVMLGVGLALLLAGGRDAVWGASGPEVPAERESMTTPQEAGVPRPMSGSMVLMGTIVSAKPAEGRAVIADARGQQRMYALGDVIFDGSTLTEIQRDYIVLRQNDYVGILRFSWKAVAQLLDRITPVARNADPEGSVGDDPEVLRSAMFTSPELLLQVIGASPAVEGGNFFGYRVMQPEDPAFLESLGLKPGDILTAVNGVSLNTPDRGASLLNALSGTGRLTFTVRRGTETRVLGH